MSYSHTIITLYNRRNDLSKARDAAFEERRKGKGFADWLAKVRLIIYCGRLLAYKWTNPDGQNSKLFPSNSDSLRERFVSVIESHVCSRNMVLQVHNIIPSHFMDKINASHAFHS